MRASPTRGRASRLRFDQVALRRRREGHRGSDLIERGAAIHGAQIVLATGAAGITLLEAKRWQDSPTLEMVADANASPPAGIEGVALGDRGTQSHGKILFGPLGFGALKLAVHRACIARLFEQNDLLLDAKEIYALAKTMVG
jgi:hypothetical protein